MLIILVFIFSFLCYHFAKRRIIFLTNRYQVKTRALPGYYGMSIAIWNLCAALASLLILSLCRYAGLAINYIYSYLSIIAIFITLLVYIFAALKGRFRAQLHFELVIKWLLRTASWLSIFLSLAILFTILFESIKFFNIIPIDQFLLGIKWSPQTPNHPLFGMIPVLTGTLLITAIAMLIATPLGLFSAIYLAEYTDKRTRDIIKPILEILAGIPTVVYGYFAAIIVGPFIRLIGEKLGCDISTESALAAGIVMGIMIIPFILSLSDDAIISVPQNLRDAAFALGSTKAETITKVVLPAASSGITSAILLAISRAIGETMIVTMAAGISARFSLNPLDSVSSFTAQIVALLVGDQEFDSPKTLSAFALALTLFILTLLLNLWAIIIIKKEQRKRYE